ncbi:hypothetical protein [Phreatobacter sp.]|uniref:hypothetical protein n=1 Tax=Phreatobacter sp. TaxID=1966341 RepID=UPI0025F47705|nr:hypothetical protein [Phreatobacter sp.]
MIASIFFIPILLLWSDRRIWLPLPNRCRGLAGDVPEASLDNCAGIPRRKPVLLGCGLSKRRSFCQFNVHNDQKMIIIVAAWSVGARRRTISAAIMGKEKCSAGSRDD